MMVIEQDAHTGMFSVNGGGNCGACRVVDRYLVPRVMAGTAWRVKQNGELQQGRSVNGCGSIFSCVWKAVAVKMIRFEVMKWVRTGTHIRMDNVVQS